MRAKKSIERILPNPNSITKVDSKVWEILGLKYAVYGEESQLIALCKSKSVAKALIGKK
jgi:hypothetical protein